MLIENCKRDWESNIFEIRDNTKTSILFLFVCFSIHKFYFPCVENQTQTVQKNDPK